LRTAAEFSRRALQEEKIIQSSMDNETKLSPVIVADPRSFMRGCLVCWLNKLDRQLHLFATPDAVRTVKESAAPGAVILSASADPEGNSWLSEQVAGVRHAAPDVPIVLIMDETPAAAGQEFALSAGCQGFIPLSSSLEVAFAALRLVMAGGRYFPHLAATRSAKAVLRMPAQPPRPAGILDLTPREQAVCELLSGGLPNKIIARKLGLAVSTVKIHVHHILEKLAVQNRTEVALRMAADSPRLTVKTAERPVSRPQVGPEAL
jgi:DNA-binding NarL/FixJ family response regulator